MALQMAATTAAPAGLRIQGTSQVSSARNGMCGASLSLAPVRSQRVAKRGVVSVTAAAASDSMVPDMNKRVIMNLLTLGAISAPAIGILGPFAYFFVPASSGGGGAGIVAKDEVGNDVTAKGWLKTHAPGDRALVQGLKGDPTYLVVETDGTLANYGVNAVCTHLGCVVPWNVAENKFACPCHGSQYNNQGKVIRGPAPLSLALAHADVIDEKVILSTWSETDFRTGEAPWWS